jgi:hypothetical protein
MSNLFSFMESNRNQQELVEMQEVKSQIEMCTEHETVPMIYFS